MPELTHVAKTTHDGQRIEAWEAIHDTLVGGERIALPPGAHAHWGTAEEIEATGEALASTDLEKVHAQGQFFLAGS